MIAATRPTFRRAATYPDGRVYTSPRGRYAPRAAVEDQIEPTAPVVQGCPSSDEFVIELDFDTTEPESSFDVIENSSFVKSLCSGDHSGEVNADLRHFVLSTYDDVFELIATEFAFDLDAVPKE